MKQLRRPELVALERRFRRSVLFAWGLPVAVSVPLMSFLGFYTLPDALLAVGTFTGAYCLAFAGLAVLVLGRLLKSQLVVLEHALEHGGAFPSLRGLGRIPRVFVLLLTGYVCTGPIVANFTLALLRGHQYSTTDHLYAIVGALPSVLVAAFLVFFHSTDLLGRALGPLGIRYPLAPLRLKFAILGLASPLVVNVVMLVYYHRRTGFLELETVALWTLLLIIAGLGAWTAYRSLQSSLAPLRERAADGLRARDRLGPLQPRSLDEIGELTLAWNEMLEAQSEADARLRQAQKMQAVGQLTGGIAHDFNNLLTVVTGNAELLRLELEEKPELRQYVSEIALAAKKGAGLTNRLLAFGRPETLHPEPILVAPLLDGMWGLLKTSLGEGIELERDCQAHAWRCEVDRDQLETAILNLAINARDAMPGGGRLTVTVRNEALLAANAPDGCVLSAPPGDYVVVSVKDSGSGIVEENLDRLFEPFYTTKAMGDGTGLGLSMVFSFVKRSGGGIFVDSETGQGSEFQLFLPRSHAEALTTGTEDESVDVSLGGGEHILVAEDDPAVRELIVVALQRCGYRVHAAREGAEALTLARELPAVDLLLTDMILPGGLSGPELAEVLTERHRGTPVLFISGYSEEQLPAKALETIHHEFLEKPFSPHVLVSRVHRALHAYQGKATSEGGTSVAGEITSYAKEA